MRQRGGNTGKNGVPRPRLNDTEIKYVFNLLEKHWHKGNKFIIELESTLYACDSCKGYLTYLKELAKREGKIVEIKIIATEDVISINDIKRLPN